MDQTFLNFPTDKQAASPSWPSSVSGSASEPMIDLRKIVKKFKNAAGEFTVLKGVDLQIGRGEFVSIVGKSGSGKSRHGSS